MSEKKCVPCNSGMEPLDHAACLKYLKNLQNWELIEDGKAIKRKFKFKNFKLAMEFANKVGSIAEEYGHHPLVSFGWGFCSIKWKTGKINGLHQNDFVMAELTDGLFTD